MVILLNKMEVDERFFQVDVLKLLEKLDGIPFLSLQVNGLDLDC